MKNIFIKGRCNTMNNNKGYRAKETITLGLGF